MEVDGRVAQLRAQMKDDQQSKQQDGGKPEGKSKAKAKAKAKQAKLRLAGSFHPDFQGPLTVMEKELNEVGLGPDLSWHTSFRPGQVTDDTLIWGK